MKLVIYSDGTAMLTDHVSIWTEIGAILTLPSIQFKGCTYCGPTGSVLDKLADAKCETAMDSKLLEKTINSVRDKYHP
jgi:hypothetical protein